MRRGGAWFLRNFATNFNQPLPLRRKLWLATRNTWTKVSHLQSCCGHPGEPGC